MTFERDLFISFSGGIFAGLVIVVVALLIDSDKSFLGKIVIGIICLILFSVLYGIVAFLAKKFYNQYIP